MRSYRPTLPERGEEGGAKLESQSVSLRQSARGRGMLLCLPLRHQNVKEHCRVVLFQYNSRQSPSRAPSIQLAGDGPLSQLPSAALSLWALQRKDWTRPEDWAPLWNPLWLRLLSLSYSPLIWTSASLPTRRQHRHCGPAIRRFPPSRPHHWAQANRHRRTYSERRKNWLKSALPDAVTRQEKEGLTT